MNEIKQDNLPPKINSIAELKELIAENQIGLKKGYSNKDLYRFAIDERRMIHEGHDVAREYMNLLPTIMTNGKKLDIFKKEDKENDTFELAISCYIFSGFQIQMILDFLDSFNQPVVEFTKFNRKDGA